MELILEYQEYQHFLNLKSRTNIIDSYLANNCGKITIIINEFNNIQYPQFDVLINGNVISVYKIPSRSEFSSSTFKLEKIDGRDLFIQEEIEIIKIFNSQLTDVYSPYNILGNMRMLWDTLNADGMIFDNNYEI